MDCLKCGSKDVKKFVHSRYCKANFQLWKESEKHLLEELIEYLVDCGIKGYSERKTITKTIELIERKLKKATVLTK